MKLSAIAILLTAECGCAFAPQLSHRMSTSVHSYLDEINKWVEPDGSEDDDVEVSREESNMSKEQIDRAGPGTWEGFVDFDEFDGGDGQMGVAGDGNAKLEKFDMTQMAKSKTMSAKNAWGTSTGYADSLVEKGVDIQRAQQLENWNNQQEVLQKRKQQQYMTESFDSISTEENWRDLSKFGVERNQEFDMDETFGQVTPGDLTDTIELAARLYGPAAVHEFTLRNEYMGFADFRAAFVSGTGPDWTIEPSEGSLNAKADTPFLLRFKAQNPGGSEGILVIETEDFKKTFRLIGKTS